ncbi:hypothetical protein [Mycobacterium sp.]|uniref:hypothetical protein n=1 Tax=Mycobacterium sp. TaxID=1785 RepID=UPI003C71FD9F
MKVTVRLIPAAAVWALWALAQAPAASADPPQPVPQPPFLPTPNFFPGAYGYLYNIYVVPPPSTVDARGVHATANVDESQEAYGMPGSQLGNTPPVAGFFTGASMQRYVTIGQTAQVPVFQGVNAMTLSPAVPPEDPSGIPPQNPPGPESTQPGPAPVIVPPILESPGGKPFGAAGGGAGHA